jgi:hypothetical protein
MFFLFANPFFFRASRVHISQVADMSWTPCCAAQEPGDFRSLPLTVPLLLPSSSASGTAVDGAVTIPGLLPSSHPTPHSKMASSPISGFANLSSPTGHSDRHMLFYTAFSPPLPSDPRLVRPSTATRDSAKRTHGSSRKNAETREHPLGSHSYWLIEPRRVARYVNSENPPALIYLR